MLEFIAKWGDNGEDISDLISPLIDSADDHCRRTACRAVVNVCIMKNQY